MNVTATSGGPPDRVLAYWRATYSDAGVRYLTGQWADMSADQHARDLRLAEGCAYHHGFLCGCPSQSPTPEAPNG